MYGICMYAYFYVYIYHAYKLYIKIRRVCWRFIYTIFYAETMLCSSKILKSYDLSFFSVNLF